MAAPAAPAAPETPGTRPVSGEPGPLLELDHVTKEFPVRGGVLRRVRGHVHALSDVSLAVRAGETLGLVGESGSGKTTLGRLALRLLDPTSGTVRFGGEDVTGLSGRRLLCLRRHAQVVFQDQYS